jgi:hypothetical protein
VDVKNPQIIGSVNREGLTSSTKEMLCGIPFAECTMSDPDHLTAVLPPTSCSFDNSLYATIFPVLRLEHVLITTVLRSKIFAAFDLPPIDNTRVPTLTWRTNIVLFEFSNM